MEAFSIIGFIFGVVAMPMATMAFFAVLAHNKEIEALKKEIAVLKEKRQS